MGDFKQEILLDFEEEKLRPLYKKLYALQQQSSKEAAQAILSVQQKIDKAVAELYSNLDNWNRTQVSRHPNRPYALDYVEKMCDYFIELHGDRNYSDCPTTVCGLGLLNGESVVIVAQQKGRNMAENIKRNFGMPQPEGYRKALRFFQLAEKFNKPIITLVDTPGAYPGIEGEERSQGEAIARNLKEMAGLSVPIVSVVLGEGGSGGALGISLANYVMMMEFAIYSVISPESCASILWRDATQKKIAANVLKNDADTAFRFNIIDEIIKEPIGGAHRDWNTAISRVQAALIKILKTEKAKSAATLIKERIDKFSAMGVYSDLSDKTELVT